MEPKLLALDFDGVICDGMVEYFQTTQLTYAKIWSGSIDQSDLEGMFIRLRPLIETGWEMPVLLRAIALGMSEAEISADWSTTASDLVQQEGLNPQEIAASLDHTRDEWIATDLTSWLNLHRFYPGVIPRLHQLLQSDTLVYIISTKEGRFISQLLARAGLSLPGERIIGKEIKQPKYQTIRDLLQEYNYSPEVTWFVEDRSKALELVQGQPDLEGVKLFLATWGYNTPSTREAIAHHSRIQLLSLDQFNQEFSAWCC